MGLGRGGEVGQGRGGEVGEVGQERGASILCVPYKNLTTQLCMYMCIVNSSREESLLRE